MTDKFTIEVEGQPTMLGLEYDTTSGLFGPYIRLSKHVVLMNQARCNAILRKLAELDDDETTGIKALFDPVEGTIKLVGGIYREEDLENYIHLLRKAKYHKKTLTPEEKIEKALELLSLNAVHDHDGHLSEAINILES